jgi:hypothetical protein
MIDDDDDEDEEEVKDIVSSFLDCIDNQDFFGLHSSSRFFSDVSLVAEETAKLFFSAR